MDQSRLCIMMMMVMTGVCCGVRCQGYHMLSNQSGVMSSHLPAVASFHSSADMPAAGCIYGQSVSQLNGMDSGSGSSSQTGDALGKALASVRV